MQSPTAGDATASRAVDGNSADQSDTFSETILTRNPLWEVDLGAVRDITDIEIFLPGDAELSDFWIIISDEPFSSGNLNAALNDPGVTGFEITDPIGSSRGHLGHHFGTLRADPKVRHE